MRLLHKPVGLMTDRLLFCHPIAHLSAHFILYVMQSAKGE